MKTLLLTSNIALLFSCLLFATGPSIGSAIYFVGIAALYAVASTIYFLTLD